MKKVLITGAAGFVGSRLCKKLKEEYQVFGPTRKEWNLLEKEQTRRQIEQIKPDYIIHLAAVSDTGYCQMHEQETWEMNVKAAVEIAKASKAVDAKYLFMSSDQIYNGSRTMNAADEQSIVKPVTVYGKQKLEAETRIQEVDKDAVLLRVTWMYDFYRNKELYKNNNNLFIRLQHAVRDQTPVSLPIREYRGITWVSLIVDAFPKLFGLPGGIYNFGSENDESTYDIAKYFLSTMGYEREAEKILQKNNTAYAEYPRNLKISTEKLKKYGIYIAQTKEGFLKCLNDYKMEYTEKDFL